MGHNYRVYRVFIIGFVKGLRLGFTGFIGLRGLGGVDRTSALLAALASSGVLMAPGKGNCHHASVLPFSARCTPVPNIQDQPISIISGVSYITPDPPTLPPKPHC